jgi:acetate CoA/acetoacetate CoA-transferase alpha subunit
MRKGHPALTLTETGKRWVERRRFKGAAGANGFSGGSGSQDTEWREPADWGFMAVGSPERVIDEIVRQGKCELTVIANDTATPGVGIGKLISAQLVRKVIASHIGLNPETQHQMIRGELIVQLVPQDTLVERIRAGGYGLGGILTPTGVGTEVEKGKQVIEVEGCPYLLEVEIHGDFALAHAFLADYLGNLSYALTARNYNRSSLWPEKR